MILNLARTRRALFAIAIAGLAIFAPNAAPAQQVTVPGSTVSLVPPSGFVLSTDFSGFTNKDITGSILIVEFPPVAHEQISVLFKDLETAKRNFARQQVTLDTIEEIDVPAGKIPLAIGTQKVGPATFDKWIALLKGSKTVLLTVQAPQQAKLGTDTVKKMLASLTLGEGASIAEKVSALPFTVTIAAPFRAVDTVGGLGVIMTVGSQDTDPGEVQPGIILIHQQTPTIDMSNIETASEQMIKATRGYSDATVTKTERTPFAGVDGIVTSGTRQRPDGSVRHFVHYLGVGPENRYIRMIASADEKQMSDLRGTIDIIARSIAFKTPK
jgi:hypothetical protein